MTDILIYLRKSRKDIESERKSLSNGESYDTMERHRKQLLAIAKRDNLNIVGIHEEVVSGEYISERPEVQKLLRAVEQSSVDAVLVMDLDRLGRGDMLDSGIIDRAFRQSSTKIITVSEIYDPNAENWELTFGVKSIIAREELKQITRRMQRGRRASAAEGKHIAKKPPYGYLRDENLKLYPNPETAWVVQKIYDLTIDGIGRNNVARELDRLNVHPPVSKRNSWDASTISTILKNEVYYGAIVWGKFKHTKTGEGTKRTKVPKDEWQVTENAHEPLITKEQFDLAQRLLKDRAPSVMGFKKLTNPLAGVLKCEVCGYTMAKVAYTDRPNPTVACKTPSCHGVQKGTVLPLVEEKILEGLEDMITEFESIQEKIIVSDDNVDTVSFAKKTIEKKLSEIEVLEKQKSNLHDLLEQGVYDIDTFIERQKSLSTRIENLSNEVSTLQSEVDREMQREKQSIEYIPSVKKVVEAYRSIDDAELKNKLLKSVLEKVTYLRTQDMIKRGEFVVKLYPKM